MEGETTPSAPARGILNAQPNAIHSRTRLEAEKYLFEASGGTGLQPVVLRAGVIYGKDVKLITAARSDQLALDDLFVRQNGAVFGAPVDHRFGAVGQALGLQRADLALCIGDLPRRVHGLDRFLFGCDLVLCLLDLGLQVVQLLVHEIQPALILLSGAALARMDAVPPAIGIYFDTAATQASLISSILRDDPQPLLFEHRLPGRSFFPVSSSAEHVAELDSARGMQNSAIIQR